MSLRINHLYFFHVSTYETVQSKDRQTSFCGCQENERENFDKDVKKSLKQKCVRDWETVFCSVQNERLQSILLPFDFFASQFKQGVLYIFTGCVIIEGRVKHDGLSRPR